MVSAVGSAGGFGLLAGDNMPVGLLRKQILEIRRLTSHPFGVNIIALAPAYPDHLELVCKLQCEFVVFACGISKKREIRQAREAGAKVICFASTEPLAMATPQFDSRLPVIPVRALKNEGTVEFGKL